MIARLIPSRRVLLKPAPRDKWYCDGNGLYLRVRATGGRSWVLRRYAEERGPIAANRALSILKTALRFAVDAGYLEISPVDRLSNELIGGAEVSRDRVLTDEELRPTRSPSRANGDLDVCVELTA
jgi:hypothetical protein